MSLCDLGVLKDGLILTAFFNESHSFQYHSMGGLTNNHVTVGIVGGGVAGLALARMLELSGISYRLWEAHRRFAPPAGASVGVLPNGLRILDQLGMIDSINKYNVKRQVWEHRDADGRLHASFNPGAVMEEKYVLYFFCFLFQ